MADTTMLSPKFQISIPKTIREQTDLKAGQKLEVLIYGDRIELLYRRDMRSMRGFLQGIDTDVLREKSDRA